MKDGLFVARVVRELNSPERTLRRRGYDWRRAVGEAPAVADNRFGECASLLLEHSPRKLLRYLFARQSPVETTDLQCICAEPSLHGYLGQLHDLGLIAPVDNGWEYAATIEYGELFEWFVGQMFEAELSSPAAHRVRLGDLADGADLDVVAVVDARIAWVECKSAAPSSITDDEIRAFLSRDEQVKPDISLMLVDSDDPIEDMRDAVIRVASPAIRCRSGIGDDVDWTWSPTPLPDYGNALHMLRRVFITNNQPSVLRSVRGVLKYYFQVVQQTAYWS